MQLLFWLSRYCSTSRIPHNCADTVHNTQA